MNVLILAVIGLIALFAFIHSKKFANPIVLFCGLWFVVVLFSSIKLYGMLDFSDSVFTIIFIGVLSFCVGAYFSMYKAPVNRGKTSNETAQTKIVVNWPIANLFLAVSFISMVVLTFIAIYYLLTGRSFYDIHGMFNDNDEFGWFLPKFINWIAVPCLYGSVFIAISLLFSSNRTKRESAYIYYVAVTVIMYVFGSASRMMMGIIAIMSLILFQCFNKQFSKKQKKRILFLLLCACLIVLFFIIVRKGSRNINTIYAYFSIPAPIFAHWKDWFDVSGNYLYGGATFYGVLSWINFFTSKIGLELPVVVTAREYIVATQDTWLVLFQSGYVYNAFCTIFYYFYMDFGIFGVIIFDLLFGFISYRLYHNIFVLKNYRLLPYYLLIIQCIIFSFVRWQGGTQGFIIELIVVYCSVTRKQLYKNTKKCLVKN